MAAISLDQMVNAIEEAFAEAGASATFVPKGPAQPRRFYISTDQGSFSIWIYAWTLTHGGGAKRPRDEYRIQLTSVTSPLPLNPDGPTLLLGYEPNIKCYSGFDLHKHLRFSQKSPSIQIKIDTLHQALRDGYAFCRKGNDELAIAFRPDNILSYAQHAEILHKQGSDSKTLELLTKAAEFKPIPPKERLPKARQRIVGSFSRLARDSAFRHKVKVAYDHKCAVTGLQLRLIDAAHILPVECDGSTDEVQNGLCLSPTYHRAYDRGLIYLTEQYKMVINPQKKAELIKLGLYGGLPQFESTLGRQVFLPADRNQWPDVALIRAANKVRKA